MLAIGKRLFHQRRFGALKLVIDRIMKEKASRISLIVSGLIYVASLLAACAPPGCLPLFVLMGATALVPAALGPKLYRILGIAALILAVGSGINEYYQGKRLHSRLLEIMERGAKTNSVTK